MDKIQILNWFIRAGITELVQETPMNRMTAVSPDHGSGLIPNSESGVLQKNDKNFSFVNSESSALPKSDKNFSFVPNKCVNKPDIVNSTDTSPHDTLLSKAHQLAKRCQTLADLEITLKENDLCALQKTASHVFIGTGKKDNPSVLCLFDSPKTADERSGDLFQSDGGRLLLKMSAAIGLFPDKNTYIAPVIPWRLPGDRKPTQTEISLCHPFVDRLIEIIHPDFLILFGSLPLSMLFETETLSRARQQKLTYKSENDMDFPVFTTFAPEFLILNQNQKKHAWEDLQKMQAIIFKSSS